ncbi:MAG: C39 family peptidase [Microcoleaceae cyanobacterium]
MLRKMMQVISIDNVPYFSQLDNSSGTGYRECFSSSCAMLAAFYGKVSSDDEYNFERQKYGDTTSFVAQTDCLSHSYKLSPRFNTNGTIRDIHRLIDDGTPVAVGWLHKGEVMKPYGGHWTVIVGYVNSERNATIHHDPYGEADMVNGRYLNSWNGKNIHYTNRNWLKRWSPEGLGHGYYLYCNP